MDHIIVLYKSNTGFTKKYAEWIAEELDCKAVSIKDIHDNDIKNYKTIIFGGGIHAGRISGLHTFKKITLNQKDINTIIFATGAAPKEATNIDHLIRTNLNQDEASSIPLFYFHSGINYENMGLGSKGLMKMFKAMLKNNKNKTPEEQGMYETISKSHDYSKKEYITPLVKYVKEQ
ncbi:flavodoxin domain-containing protein [Mobilitalea sibirica]|uniref:Flavodoxin domain-containing protein n=1 Tax=Mobilitalea sibirica TaxID=1462919 RepID=A0A8J7HAW5_9FIRM|nr:flavodoxin domain-containing protein [Mobilitalea sibirica]MBH1940391.1 flavodoxin domain-containing protein [Mobilitalea sibirica]